MSERVLYKIKNWKKHYENHRSRQVSKLSWFPLSNRFDGRSFRKLTIECGGDPRIYGAWIAILSIASKCKIRGVLCDDDGPLDSQDFEIMTGFKQEHFEKAIKTLLKIGWLETVAIGYTQKEEDEKELKSAVAEDSQLMQALSLMGKTEDDCAPLRVDVTALRDDATLHNSTLHNKTEHNITLYKKGVEDFTEVWNGLGKPFPKLIQWTKDRDKVFKERWKSESFRANWSEALKIMTTRPFCRGEGEGGWVATPDWFLREHTVTHLLEGWYSGAKKIVASKQIEIGTEEDFAEMQKRLDAQETNNGNSH